jgi:hypothetical protein
LAGILTRHEQLPARIACEGPLCPPIADESLHRREMTQCAKVRAAPLSFRAAIPLAQSGATQSSLLAKRLMRVPHPTVTTSRDGTWCPGHRSGVYEALLDADPPRRVALAKAPLSLWRHYAAGKVN